ncbi:MAG: MerR family transcriptional regulator [Gammaproteobacteria bacterium]|nr:MerR family transcriptional regulator [Gammaproteobacteria bacterium]MDP2140270.1 MerR family transcriptional regulator [Gammaproteobacteria bacterium]MDP2348145.1 MerR family transcriptional regulator [Gammaproteobacteria bacterium]
MSYTVKQLAGLSGVSVRTLHHYDETGLLKPTARTDAGYRLYGEKELLRLQQILFYRALGMPLREIQKLLDAPDFDTMQALAQHRKALASRKKELAAMLTTVDKTIAKLKGDIMMSDKELYDGFPKDARKYRGEAVEKYGEKTIRRSEDALRKLSKAELQKLQDESTQVLENLAAHMHLATDCGEVQTLIARHYELIRMFWGTSGLADNQACAYAGLGQLFVDDERFMSKDGKPRSEFALFLRDAMKRFSDSTLR